MMSSSFSLVLVFFATAGASPTYKCVLKSSDAVTNGLNAALAIWAASKRCPPQMQSPVLCEQDVATAISQLSALGSDIAGIVSACSDATENQCALAANGLVSATSGLAAAGGAIAEKCTDIKSNNVLGLKTLLGKCTSGAAGGINSIFHATVALQDMQASCSGSSGDSCAVPVLEVVKVLSSFGAYVSGAFADCSAFAKSSVDTDVAGCSKAVLSGIAKLSAAAEAGVKMDQTCKAAASRLYLDAPGQPTSYSPSFMALAASLPLAALLSFLAGSRFAKARGHATTHLDTPGQPTPRSPMFMDNDEGQPLTFVESM